MRDPLGNKKNIKISLGARRNSGHAATNIPYAPEEHSDRGASEFPRILLESIPGTQSFRRVACSNRSFRMVASSNRYKKSECLHFCTSFSYIHYKLSSEYCAKRRLQVQDRPARLHTFMYQFIQAAESTSGLPSKTRFNYFGYFPSVLTQSLRFFTSLGYTVTGYLHRLGISVIPYLDDWLVHHPDRQVLLQHQVQLLKTLDLVWFILGRKKSELDLVQDIQFLGIRLRLDLRGSLAPRVKAREIVARACELSSEFCLVIEYPNLWAHLIGPQVLSFLVVCT